MVWGSPWGQARKIVAVVVGYKYNGEYFMNIRLGTFHSVCWSYREQRRISMTAAGSILLSLQRELTADSLTHLIQTDGRVERLTKYCITFRVVSQTMEDYNE